MICILTGKAPEIKKYIYSIVKYTCKNYSEAFFQIVEKVSIGYVLTRSAKLIFYLLSGRILDDPPLPP